MLIKYNKDSATEKPIGECPAKCIECSAYENGWCTANNYKHSITYSFADPKYRPLPMPLNCYWWYANNVWHKVSEQKQEEYITERNNLFIANPAK